MSVINVQIDSQSGVFAPGATLTGHSNWALDREAAAIEIHLIWFTRGKGDADHGKPSTQRIERPAREGSQPFSFTLPAGPYSFSGRLITLSWAVEAVVLPQRVQTRREIVLTPGVREIMLP